MIYFSLLSHPLSLSLCCYNWWLCLPWFYLCPRPNSKFGLRLFTALFSSQKGFTSLYIFALSCLYPFDSLHPGKESPGVLHPKDLHQAVKGCSKAPWWAENIQLISFEKCCNSIHKGFSKDDCVGRGTFLVLPGLQVWQVCENTFAGCKAAWDTGKCIRSTWLQVRKCRKLLLFVQITSTVPLPTFECKRGPHTVPL